MAAHSHTHPIRCIKPLSSSACSFCNSFAACTHTLSIVLTMLTSSVCCSRRRCLRRCRNYIEAHASCRGFTADDVPSERGGLQSRQRRALVSKRATCTARKTQHLYITSHQLQRQPLVSLSLTEQRHGEGSHKAKRCPHQPITNSPRLTKSTTNHFAPLSLLILIMPQMCSMSLATLLSSVSRRI